MSTSRIAFCLAEDRPDCGTGLRLAILSLCRHCPSTPIYVYRPDPDSHFSNWAAQFPQVTHIPTAPPGATTWNCKPHALKPLLLEGYRDAVWLDSDVIITRDCRPLLAGLDESALAITQEPASRPNQGTAIRTRAWNLEVARSLPVTLNSSVLRVTKHHLALLECWKEYLCKPEYVECETIPLDDRPVHLASDQDVLNALLGAPQFASIPVHVLQSAIDIIHTGGALGYSSLERLRGIFRPKPTFLHATAGKPWLWLSGAPYWSQRNFFSWHRRLLQELSPYLYEARRYRSQLGEDARWMYWRTGTGTMLRLAGLGHFALRGLPLTIFAGLLQAAKTRRLRTPNSPGGEAATAAGRH